MKKAVSDRLVKVVARPNIFDDWKSQAEEIKAFREWSWVFEKFLSAVGEGYMKDVKEIHETPNENFDWDLAISKEKTRWIKLFGLLG